MYPFTENKKKLCHGSKRATKKKRSTGFAKSDGEIMQALYPLSPQEPIKIKSSHWWSATDQFSDFPVL